MSQSIHITAFRTPNDKWKKMKRVFDACREAEVRVPDEVSKFFGDIYPNDNGMEIDITKRAIRTYDRPLWYEIRLEDIPSDVVAIRFELSN